MRELDDRLAGSRRIELLARWWAQASEKARYETLRQAALTNDPKLDELHLAAFLAEAEQGTVAQG